MHSKPKQRRRHAPELKESVLKACGEAGASVAAIAREHGLNDNLVHQWRRGRGIGALTTKVQRQSEASTVTAQFIALPLPATTPGAASEAAVPPDIRLEIRRGTTVVNVTWPLTAASASAAWLREVLR